MLIGSGINTAKVVENMQTGVHCPLNRKLDDEHETFDSLKLMTPTRLLRDMYLKEE